MLNYYDDSCRIIEIYIMGSNKMNNNLQKLKDKLDALLVDNSLDSQEALYLSREIDSLIVEYYRSRKSN